MKTLIKECFRTIKKSFRKFLSILLVVFLGVGFFTGIKATSPDMKDTLNRYVEKNNLHDFNLISTWGIDKEDINYLEKKGYNFETTWTTDAIVLEKREEVVKILSYQQKDKIDKINLVEGKFPTKNNECVIEKNQYTEFHQIGDKITVKTDSLKEKKLTIVGFVESPEYLSLERGSTNLLTGKISYFMYVLDDNFNLDYWTNLKIDLKTKEHTFSENYKNLIEEEKQNLKEITSLMASNRYDKTLKEIEDGIEKIGKEKAKFKKIVNDNKQKIKNSYIKIKEEKQLLEQNKETVLKEFAQEENNMNANLMALREKLTETENIQNETNLIKDQIKSLEEGLIVLNQNRIAKLSEIEKYHSLLNNQEKEIKLQERKLKKEKNKAFKKFSKAKKELEDKKNNLEKPEWYILTRNENIGYYSYSQDTDRIANIAEVFPLVFFVVAVFICLTSMTRMVEEERSNLGTLKSLGFTNNQIMFKYLLYAFLATLIGSITGSLVGMNLLPKLVFKMYALMYNLDELEVALNIKYSLIGTLIAILCTMLATFFVARKYLKEVPAELMRPKSPKPGKKVFLEKIPFVWKHLSFSQKVTIRNVFRYKKRFLMTIIGIMGSTSLIIAGYGLKDCIMGMVPNQFQKIFNYELEITLKDNLTLQEEKQTLLKLNEISSIEKVLPIYKEQIEITNYKTNQDITLLVPLDDITDFINLNDRKTKTKYKLDDNIIITEKIAELLNVKKNDTLNLSGEKNYNEKVGHITENYISHYVYMPKEIYNDENFNSILVKTKEISPKEEKEISNEILEIDTISSLNWISSTENMIADMMENFEFVVGVLIISSGLLTFIVLYNLASVNISERQRELATIKVLGFKDYEVYTYVNKETIILTIIGILCGLVFGKFLTIFIIKTCELDTFMFNTHILWQTYFLAILIMILWTFIVSIITYFSLKKVDMIESLKSVE